MIFAYTYSPIDKIASRDYKNILLHFYGLKPFKPSPSEALILKLNLNLIESASQIYIQNPYSLMYYFFFKFLETGSLNKVMHLCPITELPSNHRNDKTFVCFHSATCLH